MENDDSDSIIIAATNNHKMLDQALFRRFDDAIEYYEKAINNNLYSASIDLAKLYFKKYMMQVSKDNSKNGYLLLAVNLINSYYDKYNDEEKKEADYLLKTFKDLL